MAEQKRAATAAEISHALATLSEFSHKVASMRSLLSGDSNVGEELMNLVVDAADAQRINRHGGKLREVNVDAAGDLRGFPVSLANIVIRCCSLAAHLGIDIGEVVASRANNNAQRIRRNG